MGGYWDIGQPDNAMQILTFFCGCTFGIGKRNYDQKRSMEAKKVKSDWLVIGRAITQGNVKKNIQILAKELR